MPQAFFLEAQWEGMLQSPALGTEVWKGKDPAAWLETRMAVLPSCTCTPSFAEPFKGREQGAQHSQ